MNQTMDKHRLQHTENEAFPPEEEIDLLELMRKLNRRRWVIISMFILTMAVTLLYVSCQKPRYTAKAHLMLNSRTSNVVNMKAVLSELPSRDEWAIQSEIDIIKSPSFLERAVEKLNLADDPLFNPDLRPKPEKTMLARAYDWLEGFWVAKPTPADETAVDPAAHADKIRKSIANALAGGLEVERMRSSYTIELAYTLGEPKRCADVVNAIADAYLMDQLETKYEATRRANEWLSKRLNSLRREVHAAELAVQKVKQRGNLVQAKGSTLLEDQIAKINAQLVDARVGRSQAEARLNWVRKNLNKSGAEDSIVAMMASPEIQRLRSEKATLQREQAEKSSRYGPRHPEMLKIAAELKDIREKIKEASDRMIISLANEVEISKAKENALMRSLDEMKSQTSSSLKTKVELAELERQAEVARTLYENFLSRFRETSEQEQLQQPDARIISYADPPKSPSYPNKKLMFGLGGIIGLMLGLGCAYLLESLDRGFRKSDQVEMATGLPVMGMMPVLRNKKSNPADYVVEKPQSRMAEAIRAVRAAIQLSNVDQTPKTVLVASALAGEGKSTLCAVLGRVAAMSGAKILLIEGDLRRPGLDKMLGLEPAARLEEVLAGEKDLKSAIAEDPKTGMHVLCAMGHSANAADLLSSQRMGRLLKKTAEEYDLVIIDTPPLMGISDSWELAAAVDAILFAIRWAETPRDSVNAALRQMEMMNLKINGIVLAQVDVRQQARYGYGGYEYYYGRYNKYYQE